MVFVFHRKKVQLDNFKWWILPKRYKQKPNEHSALLKLIFRGREISYIFFNNSKKNDKKINFRINTYKKLYQIYFRVIYFILKILFIISPNYFIWYASVIQSYAYVFCLLKTLLYPWV